MSNIEHKSLTLSNAYNLFVLRCQAERFQPSTLRFYGWTLQPFFAWCEAQQVILLGDVTAHHIRAYLVEKQVVARNTDNQREASGNYNHAIACISLKVADIDQAAKTVRIKHGRATKSV